MAQSSKEVRSLRSRFPNASLTALRQEMNDLFENFFGESISGLRGETGPKVDVAETADAVEVTTDLPGFRPEEVDIDIIDNHLTISGTHSEEVTSEESDRKYHRIERRMGSFARSVWLPCPVDEEKVDAELKEGVLTIRMPKLEAAKRRKIQVKGADASSGTA